LLSGDPRRFDVTLITNESDSTSALVALHRPSGESVVAAERLALTWPPGIFSLSHVALPIAPDDPVYGAERPLGTRSVYLGRIELLGEQGLLAMPANVMLRLRYNPFFSYQENRIESFLALSE
jgi:hypothetical protein